MLDGLAELAALMRYDPEQMLGFGAIRLSFQDAATDYLRFLKPPLIAVALGLGKRFTKRNNSAAGLFDVRIYRLAHAFPIPQACARSCHPRTGLRPVTKYTWFFAIA